MNPTPLARPLVPFEVDALALATAEGWTPLTHPLDTEAGLSATFTWNDRRLFLLIAAPSSNEGTAQWTSERLARSSQTLAGALDLQVYERVVFAIGATVPEVHVQALERGGVEVWTPRTLRRLRDHRRGDGQEATPALLQVSSLKLQGFRGIVDLQVSDLSLQGPVVFVGPNGVGKSTLLDAMTMALSWLDARLWGGNRRGETPKVTDIHNDLPVGLAQLTVALGEAEVTWSIGRSRGGSSRHDLKELTQRLDAAKLLFVRGSDQSTPVVAHYSVRRAAPPKLSAADRSQRGGDIAGEDIEGVRRSEAEAARAFFRWFRDVEDMENELRLKEPNHRDVELSAARRAITAVMEGYTNLRVDRTADTMVLEKSIPGRTPTVLRFDQLSDGEKTLLAMVGDIACLLSLRNPRLPDPLLGGGVVLIDEIELHLHPAWQRVVVARLQRTFPNIQFVLTTHSPQVISEVPSSSIVLVKQVDGQITMERPLHGQGWDSNRILSGLMGVSERPDDVKARIAAVEALMDGERLEEAAASLDRLEEELGRFDSEVSRLRAVLDFLRD